MDLEVFKYEMKDLSDTRYKKLGLMCNGMPIFYENRKTIFSNNKIYLGSPSVEEKNKVPRIKSVETLYEELKSTHLMESISKTGIESIDYIPELVAINICTWDFNALIWLLDKNNTNKVYEVPDYEIEIKLSSNSPDGILADVNDFKRKLLRINMYNNATFNIRGGSVLSQQHIRLKSFTDYVRIFTEMTSVPNLLCESKALELLESTKMNDSLIRLKNCSKFGKEIESIKSESFFVTKADINETFGVNLDGCAYAEVVQIVLAYLNGHIVDSAGRPDKEQYYNMLRNYIIESKKYVIDKLLSIKIDDII